MPILLDVSGCSGFRSRDEQRTQPAQGRGLVVSVEWLVGFASPAPPSIILELYHHFPTRMFNAMPILLGPAGLGISTRLITLVPSKELPRNAGNDSLKRNDAS